MVEYVDLQCPYCQQFETQVFPDLVTRYVRPGKLKVVSRPVAFIGPDSIRGRNAVIAASRQNRMFNLMSILYDNQKTENSGWLNDSMVQSAAASVPGMDVKRLLSDQGDASVAADGKRFDTQAQNDAVAGTPTFLVGRSGGTLSHVATSSATDEQAIVNAVEQALAAHKASGQ
jgi:protein-disulfide isomerase